MSSLGPARAVCSHPQGFATAHHQLYNAADTLVTVCVNNVPVSAHEYPGIPQWLDLAASDDGRICVVGQTSTDRMAYSLDGAPWVTTAIQTFGMMTCRVRWDATLFEIAVVVDGFHYVLAHPGQSATAPIVIPNCPTGTSQGLRQFHGDTIVFNQAPNSEARLSIVVNGETFIYPTWTDNPDVLELMIGQAREQTRGNVEWQTNNVLISPVEAMDPQVAYSSALGTYSACGWGANNAAFDVIMPPFVDAPSVPVPPIEPPIVIPPVEPPIVEPPIIIQPPPIQEPPPMSDSLEERLTPVCFAVIDLPYTEAQQCAREAISAVDQAVHRAPTEFETQTFAVTREQGFFWPVGVEKPKPPYADWRVEFDAWMKARA